MEILSYDKNEIRKKLTLENIFDLLQDWGGDPMYTDFGIISTTICHNAPGEGSRKLYYYENSQLFYCYTSCDCAFDIFELAIKISEIQNNISMNLNEAVRYIAARLGISGIYKMQEKLVDWEILANYDRIQQLDTNNNRIVLKEYNPNILDRLNYKIKISPWLKEGINQEAINKAHIGYYLGGDQITIPHYDIENRFIGLRGRTMCALEAEVFGKYRPLKINKILYTHPLGMNLYGINWAKRHIKTIKKAIVFESEKSVLQYMSYFGIDNNIAVACCGSNLSIHQFMLLLECGVEEIVIAFDKQYKELNTDESREWSRKLTRINEKYKNKCLISFLWDKGKLLDYKDSPTDKGKEIFLELFKNRILI